MPMPPPPSQSILARSFGWREAKRPGCNPLWRKLSETVLHRIAQAALPIGAIARGCREGDLADRARSALMRRRSQPAGSERVVPVQNQLKLANWDLPSGY